MLVAQLHRSLHIALATSLEHLQTGLGLPRLDLYRRGGGGGRGRSVVVRLQDGRRTGSRIAGFPYTHSQHGREGEKGGGGETAHS